MGLAAVVLMAACADADPGGAGLGHLDGAGVEVPAGCDAADCGTETSSEEVSVDAAPATDVGEVSSPANGLRVRPATVELGKVDRGTSIVLRLVVSNESAAPIRVPSFQLTGARTFSIQTLAAGLGPTGPGWTSDQASDGQNFISPIELAPGASSDVLTLLFLSEILGENHGELTLYSDGAGAGEAVVMPLSATVVERCIRFDPPVADFTCTPLGETRTVEVEVTACGTLDGGAVTIDELALEPGTSPAFTLDLAGLPLAPGVALPSGTATVSPGEPPIVLPPQTRAFFRVTYTPTEVTDSWTTAQFVPEHGGIRVASNVPPGSVRVPISGPAIKPICSIPTEVVVIEGPDVDPDSLVHLRAISALQCASFSPLFAWSVRRPGSSVRTYLPGFSGDAATFKVTEPGDYLFRVEVLDSTGKTHCEADATVRARIGSDIRIDLTWTTPGDPDPTDNGPQASADLDLHFAHPWAEGEDLDGNGVFDGWFDLLYDCFWFNPNPNWGSPDPAFSKGPHLLGDSESGSVSEVVRMFPHDEALEYKVGVHAWNDNGFGGSLATVRVRIGGAVVFEAAEVPLEPLAMWEVATIKWPSGAVTPLTDVFGKPRILPHYDPAIFPGP